MQAALLNTPETPQDWERWAFAHQASHQQIIQAIAAKGGPSLTQYILWPFDPQDPTLFLQNNQQAHFDMGQATGVQTSDLQDTDLRDPAQRKNWIAEHWFEHYMVEQALGISS